MSKKNFTEMVDRLLSTIFQRHKRDESTSSNEHVGNGCTTELAEDVDKDNREREKHDEEHQEDYKNSLQSQSKGC